MFMNPTQATEFITGDSIKYENGGQLYNW